MKRFFLLLYMMSATFVCFSDAGDAHVKAPRNSLADCGGCAGNTLATLDNISQSLCCLKNEICCIGTMVNCPIQTFIHQADIPYVITKPGVYVVCEDLNNTDPLLPAISIQSDNVTLDLAHNTVASNSTYAIDVVNAKHINIFNGFLKTVSAPDLHVDTVAQLFVSHVAVSQSPDAAFVMNNILYGIFEHCSFDNSINVASGFYPAIFLVTGISDGLIIRNCEIINAVLDGFRLDLSSGAGYGISFENCAAYTTENLYNGIAFLVVNKGPLVTFYNCQATNFNNFGFLIRGCSAVTLRQCQSLGNRLAGILIENSDQVVVDGCVLEQVQPGMIFFQVTDLLISNSFCTGPGFTGFFYNGITINTCQRVNINTTVVENFDGSGIFISNSQAASCDSCITKSCSKGFNLDQSTTILKNCVAQSNSTGIFGAADALRPIAVKDCLCAQNFIGIDTNGTSFTILDTRSGVPLNTVVDSVAGSTVITY